MPNLTPPPIREKDQNAPVWQRWYNDLQAIVGTVGGVTWDSLNFSGSNITDLETRNHEDLQNLNTTSYTHLTASDASELTGGGSTTLHSHPAGAASTITVADAAGDTTCWLLLAGSATGDLPVLSDSGLTYNASTNLLTISGGGPGVSDIVAIDGSGYSTLGARLSATDAGAGTQRYLFIDFKHEQQAISSMLVDVNTDGSSEFSISTTPAGARAPDRRVEAIRVTKGQDVAIGSGKRFYVDGTSGAGNTYIVESSSDTLDLVANNTTELRVKNTGTASTSGVGIPADHKYYLNGHGGNSWIRVTSGGSLEVSVGGTVVLGASSTDVSLRNPYVNVGDFYLPTGQKVYFDGYGGVQKTYIYQSAVGTLDFYISNGAGTTTTKTLSLTATAATIAGNVILDKTITAAATTGAQTINKTTGSVNFAAAATSLVVTNSLVTANSIIIATVATNDATMTSVQAVAASGSFTLYANAAATAETRVNFIVTN